VECPLLFLGAASEVVRVAAEERSVRFTVAPDIEGLLALHPSIDAAVFESLADKCPSRAEAESFISVSGCYRNFRENSNRLR
jgi:predicted phosphoribosyltransferase